MHIRTKLNAAISLLAEASAIATAPLPDVLAELEEELARTSEVSENEELATAVQHIN